MVAHLEDLLEVWMRLRYTLLHQSLRHHPFDCILVLPFNARVSASRVQRTSTYRAKDVRIGRTTPQTSPRRHARHLEPIPILLHPNPRILPKRFDIHRTQALRRPRYPPHRLRCRFAERLVVSASLAFAAVCRLRALTVLRGVTRVDLERDTRCVPLTFGAERCRRPAWGWVVGAR